ncbi:transcription antitermination factor NusB [Algoriphagus halophilus]|uniref:transcription antitermination protein NusB n=1 Tax=Algoriphagus halophilus TaxID=226505 RepID=UPI00358FF3A2
MALAEMKNFPSIPVKVSINEYIDISKTYSTPKSKQFVNGLLDVMSKKLTESGEIRKSGRGLLDNK